MQILPVLSDPTLKDSDDDGLLDPDDGMPFINDFTAVWYKIPNSQGNVYAVQQKYGQDNQYIIDFDNNKVYEWNGNEWIESNKDVIDVVNLEDYLVKEFGICDRAGYLVSVDIEEQFNVSTAFEVIARSNKVFTQIPESIKMGYLGMRAGVIESYFPDEDTQVNAIDIFKLLNTTKSYRSCISKVGTIPSNEKVKAFVFQFITDKSLEELEATRVYLVGKLSSQLYMTGQFLAVGGKIVTSGLAIFGDGIAKIGSGGAISIALPFGGELAGIPVAGVGVGEAALGVATGVAGATYATKAMHSGGKAYETYKKLKKVNDAGEVILDKVKDYNQARNKALEILGDLGRDSEPYICRMENSKAYGKIVGRQTADGKARWRLDFDPELGLHINVEDFRAGKGKDAIKIAIPFEGDEQLFESLLKHLN